MYKRQADGIVIADKAQSADDVLPIEKIVAVADAAEEDVYKRQV